MYSVQRWEKPLSMAEFSSLLFLSYDNVLYKMSVIFIPKIQVAMLQCWTDDVQKHLTWPMDWTGKKCTADYRKSWSLWRMSPRATQVSVQQTYWILLPVSYPMSKVCYTLAQFLIIFICSAVIRNETDGSGALRWSCRLQPFSLSYYSLPRWPTTQSSGLHKHWRWIVSFLVSYIVFRFKLQLIVGVVESCTKFRNWWTLFIFYYSCSSIFVIQLIMLLQSWLP